MKTTRSIILSLTAFISIVVIIFLSVSYISESKIKQQNKKPKLVIGIVIEQMRWDYLNRYRNKFSNSGFRRLLNDGLQCTNTHINYSPTFDAPGYASIYTGSVPSIHGITGNQWYDNERGMKVYALEDMTVEGLGSQSEMHVSPIRLMTTTIGDELHLASNFKSKVIGISLKDRGAILPGGHTANAAYFYDAISEKWTSSTYYMKELPKWVQDFNDRKLPQKFMQQDWNTLLPISEYTESSVDNSPFERPFMGEQTPVFPHNLRGGMQPDIFAYTPFANTFTFEFAKSVINNENLGDQKTPDLLTISLTPTDIIGHQFGPSSIEVEDCYIRLDKDIAGFLSFLDEKIGKDNYLLFVTSTSGVAYPSNYLKDRRIPSGNIPIDSVIRSAEIKLKEKFGDANWIKSYASSELYLNNENIYAKGINRKEFKRYLCDILESTPGILRAIDLEDISNELLPQSLKADILNGIFKGRSGTIHLLESPNWIENFNQGATHGSIYSYDTHIPLLWYGLNIKRGTDYSPTDIIDIAPTLSAILRIQEPSGSIGKIIPSVMSK